MTQPRRAEGAFRAGYRMLLRAYPVHFRDLYGMEMEETFVDQCRVALRQGRLAILLLVLASLTDVVSNGLRERFAPQPKGSGMFHFMDVRYAFRLLRRSPMFSLLTVLVLSGGLGLAIFTFSFLHTAMLKPLPLANGDRIVSILRAGPQSNGSFDAADLSLMRAETRTLSETGVYTSRAVVLGDAEHPRVLDATASVWSVFSFTRTGAMLGRTFSREDASAGAEPVIVLSHQLWRAAFGSDSTLVGRTIPLNGVATRVIGIMPEGYGFPVASEAWVPLNEQAVASAAFGTQNLYLFGRITNGVSADEARSELRVLLKRARARDRANATADAAVRIAEESATTDVSVQTFPMAQMGESGPLFLAVLNTLAGLILLLACINVTNLLLARSNERVRETAVRLALGASRARLVMQSMWESVILCVAGGAVATAIAAWGLDAITSWTRANLEGNMAFWWVWGFDRSAVIAASLFVTATIAVLGLVVSGRATSLQFLQVLQDGSARSGSRREGRVARALVVTQVSTVTLLMFFGVMAGIIAYRVVNVDVGFDTRRLLSTAVYPDGDRYKSAEARHLLLTTAGATLSQAPSVASVLLRNDLAALTDAAGVIGIRDGAAENGAEQSRAYVQALEGEIGTIGMHMLQGRSFDSRDAARGARVAIVSQEFAAHNFGTASPLGRQVRFGEGAAAEWRTVVGVASNVMHGQPFSASQSELAIYVPLQQTDAAGSRVLVRHRGDEQAARSAVHRTLRTLDANMLPPDIQSYEEILQKTSLIATATAKLFGACFAFALLLAVSGTYGLMARNIGQRTREIGVRRALGASDAMVTRLLLKQGGRQLGVGVLISVPLMALVGYGFSQVFPVGALATIASGFLVASAIVLVVLGATYVPTRRAVGTAIRDALWTE